MVINNSNNIIMKQINIYLLHKTENQPLNRHDMHNLLNENNIKIVINHNNANIIVGTTILIIKKYINKYINNNKKYLLCTAEPRWDINMNKIIVYKNRKIHIMNVYTGDIYLHCLHMLKIYSNVHKINTVPSNLNNNKVIILATNRKNNDKFSRDLNELRSKIAMIGFKKGQCIIYGKGWPKNISSGNSRYKFSVTKPELMKDYYFNLCFENTYTKNYVSEKLWDSIANHCLPIYKGSSWIYKLFPKNSFIDYNDFGNSTNLFNYISNMTTTEYMIRMNICIDVINKLINSDLHLNKNMVRNQNIINKIRYILKNVDKSEKKIFSKIIYNKSDRYKKYLNKSNIYKLVLKKSKSPISVNKKQNRKIRDRYIIK